MPGVVVLGARNLGGAIVDRFLADGWSAAAIAQSDDTLAAIRARGATAVRADVTDPDALASAIAEAQAALPSMDALVNAVSLAPFRPGAPWGGGPIADSGPDDVEAWCIATARLCASFLALGARALRAGEGGGTLVQVSNAASRRPVQGGGLWSAAQHAARAMTHAASLELRGEGIHVCFLVVEAAIDSPKSRPRMEQDGIPPDASVDMAAIADAAAYVVAQGPRGQSYELDLTASLAPWTP